MKDNRKLKNILLSLLIVLSLSSMIFTGFLANKKITITTKITKPIEEEKQEQPTDKLPNSEETSKSSMNNDALEEINKPPEIDNTDSHEKIKNIKATLTRPYYIALGIEGAIFSLAIMYLILSKFNKKPFKETFADKDKIIICLLASTLLTIGIIYYGGEIINIILSKKEPIIIYEKISNNNNPIPEKKEEQPKEASSIGKETISEEKTLTGDYESNEIDESPILVNNGAIVNIESSSINKVGGDTSNIESSDFNGVNAGVLVEKESVANIKNSKIYTNAKGSNAIFSTGENSKIYISDTEINTEGQSSSRGLDATYGGYIEGNYLTITTKGASSAALATDRGTGTIKTNNSTFTTNGLGSPIIYSTGNISIDNSTGIANSSQMVVIEGKNSATITNSSLTASALGNRNNIDKAGIMIYQSMSGDADYGKGIFTSENSSLTISKDSQVFMTAPMFFVTNTDADINLTNTKLSFGSNILISVVATSEWGIQDNNGGNATINANTQSLAGNIIVDNISALSMNLNKSSYRGIINNNNIAKNIDIKMDKDSQITLTGDSYITSLDNEDKKNNNIDLNGYKLYINGEELKK